VHKPLAACQDSDLPKV